jgi:hypothetical protein
MPNRTLLKRLDRIEKALEKAAPPDPHTFQPLFRSGKVEMLRRMGRQAFQSAVLAAASRFNGDAETTKITKWEPKLYEDDSTRLNKCKREDLYSFPNASVSRSRSSRWSAFRSNWKSPSE